MIRINKYEFGFAAFSTLVVLVVLSTCAVAAAINQSQAESSTRLIYGIMINESMALITTIVYGIFAHFATVAISKLRKRH